MMATMMRSNSIVIEMVVNEPEYGSLDATKEPSMLHFSCAGGEEGGGGGKLSKHWILYNTSTFYANRLPLSPLNPLTIQSRRVTCLLPFVCDAVALPLFDSRYHLVSLDWCHSCRSYRCYCRYRPGSVRSLFALSTHQRSGCTAMLMWCSCFHHDAKIHGS